MSEIRGTPMSRKVYVCSERHSGCHWSVIDPDARRGWASNSMNYDEETDTSLPTPIDSGCAIIDPNIYVAGGQQRNPRRKRSKTLLIFDTLTRKWIREDSNHMNTERAKPLLVPFKINNAIKLLVFGGCAATDDVWCESFDIATCKWTPLAQPPNVIKQHKTLCGFARVGDALVLWNKYLFCIYHVDTNKWCEDVCLLNYNFEGKRGKTFKGTSSVAVYDKVLFWYYGGDLFGYDLSLNRWIKSPLCSFRQQWDTPAFDCGEYPRSSMFLVTVDKEKLGLVWADQRQSPFACFWTTFQTSTNTKNGLLCASQEDVTSTYIGNPISHVLTAYQPAIVDCWSENKGNIVDWKFIRELSFTMYTESYFSFSERLDTANTFNRRYIKSKDPESDHEEIVPSVDPLPLLGLVEDSEAIMRKLINKNASKYYSMKDFECLQSDPAEAKLWEGGEVSRMEATAF